MLRSLEKDLSTPYLNEQMLSARVKETLHPAMVWSENAMLCVARASGSEVGALGAGCGHPGATRTWVSPCRMIRVLELNTVVWIWKQPGKILIASAERCYERC